jgi:hypothetical protein
MELKELLEYRRKYFAPGEDPKILALGLSSRKNLCIHPRVSGALLRPWRGLGLGRGRGRAWHGAVWWCGVGHMVTWVPAALWTPSVFLTCAGICMNRA